jgi:hypothetical protein
MEGYEFCKRRCIKSLTSDITSVFAKVFTKGDLQKAKEVLTQDKFVIQKLDLFYLSFMAGGCFSVAGFTFIYALMEQEVIFREKQVIAAVAAFTPVMRVTFLMIYIVVASGIVIRVLRKKEINYLHIFEIGYQHRISEWQLWVAGSVMIFAWTCFYCFNFV